VTTCPSITGYLDFLQAKVAVAETRGFDCDPSECHYRLFGHQRDQVAWAVRKGCAALFDAFGLGKTVMELEYCRLILEKSGKEQALIVLPLGVKQEFVRDAREILNVEVTFIRSNAEAVGKGIFLTNYETVRDGKLDPKAFGVVVLDEAAILRGLGGTKTFREFMRHFENTDSFRMVATATPSPNEYIELLAYSAFLDVMDVGQAKTRFFKRDSTKADKLTVHPHKEREFWLWVSTWAMFVQKPSDLGYSDEGYELPELDIRWHEVETDHSLAAKDLDHNGQAAMIRVDAIGIIGASHEKRSSLKLRVAKMLELRQEDPSAHRILWHDLEDERRSIEAAIPGVVSVYGSQKDEDKEKAILGFANGEFQELAGKPCMLGSGCNFQRHCSWAIFVGIGFKFADFIQAIHRLQRFGQTGRVRIDLIYTEAERSVRAELERKWSDHKKQVAIMTSIIKEYGLSELDIAKAMSRGMGVERQEAIGENWTAINNDSVLECQNMAPDSVGLILSSIPFGMMYEYSPNYADFGHTDDSAHFWEQMQYLLPELYKVLQPGRLCLIHVKDRICPGGLTGLGFQTVQPLHAECLFEFTKHGFAYLGMKTITTDVVRENNQTYRLGHTEQCKDGSRMGVGMPEYLLIFRKPPTDNSDGYADIPIIKDKENFTLGRWQIDAAGYTRSDGNRLLTPADFEGLKKRDIYRLWRKHNLETVYNFDNHIDICDALRARGMLPTTFCLVPAHSWHPDVWSDITRMRTLNGQQNAKGKEMHICPLQFDLVDRAITQCSNPGDVVFDPFGGLMTVPMRAVKHGRKGLGCELAPNYWLDGIYWLKRQDAEMSIPNLFDLEFPETEVLEPEGLTA